MSVSVSMPQLGESVTEGTVTRWLKKEGERVEVDEPLLEVSTDKVDTEIPSPASGILRGIAVDEDETVAVGAQLAVIEDSETSEAAPADDAPPQDAAEPEQVASDEPAPAETASASGSDGWSPQVNYAPPAQPARRRRPRKHPIRCPLTLPRRPTDSRTRRTPRTASRRRRLGRRMAGRTPRPSRPPHLPPRPRRRRRNTRRRRHCRVRVKRHTSPRWSASSRPSTP